MSPGPFRANLTLLGKVEPAVRRELRVTAGGTIRYAPRFAAGLRTGERVAQGEPLFTLENDDVRLKLAEAEIRARAAEANLERLERGLEVSCLRPGTGVVVGRGIVTEVARQVDRSGTVPLVATVTEDLDMPPPGEGLELKVWLTEKSDALTLPEEAVLVDGGAASVFVLDPSGSGYKARRQFVQPGSRADGRIEILDGLSGGERIAVRGAAFLADGLPAVETETEGDD